MKAVKVKNDHGPATDLYIADDVPKPAITAGQVLVKVYAFGINRMDILQRKTTYPLPPNVSPILGVEFSGVISEVGNAENATNAGFAVGDPVFGLVPGGAYAEYVACDLLTLLKMPHGMSFNEAAALPENWFTAIQVVKTVGEFKKRDKVMIHAGASGIGCAVIQLVQTLGCRRVYTTVGSDEKKEFVEKELTLHGALSDEVVPINYRTTDFEEVVKAYDAEGIDLVIDPVGADYISKDINVLGQDGRLVLMGLLSGSKCEVDLQKVLYKRLKIEGTTLRSRSPEYQSQLRDFFRDHLSQRVVNRKIKVVIDKVFPWSEIAKAHVHMEENLNMGKIVVTIVDQPFAPLEA